MPRTLIWVTALALSPLLALGCTPAEDQAAKERLSQPPPKDPMKAQAKEPLSADALHQEPDMLKRINRMRFSETALRLGGCIYEAKGDLSFTRSKLDVKSAEKVRMVQAPEGDFSIDLETGDGSTQSVVYANGVLFLKNNTGRWRASRDPTGERDALREDAAGIWRAFFDLYAHALEVKKGPEKTVDGRTLATYSLSVPDASAKAKADGAGQPKIEPTTTIDGGAPAPEPTAEETARQLALMKNWRKKARPAGGSGTIWVDRETGVLVHVDFKGALAVGDSPEPARLDVDIEANVTGIGEAHEVRAPKEAVDEIVRKKLPVRPRTVLEEAGLVPKEAPPAPGQKTGDDATKDVQKTKKPAPETP